VLITDIETAPPFTEKEISNLWLELFPKQSSSVFSIQLKKCREFLEQHKDTPFNVQVQLLRDKFTAKDRAVAQDGDVYNTKPSVAARAPKAKYSAPRLDSALPKFGPRPQGPPPASAQKRGRDDRSMPKPSRGGTTGNSATKPVIPGHKRGTACGSLNNHFGLGCTPISCIFIGTSHQKSNGKNYVWKSSAEEESVRVDETVFKQLCAARPLVNENLRKAAKLMKQAKFRAGIAALDAAADGDDSFAELDQDDINSGSVVPSSSSDSDSDGNKADAYLPADVAALTIFSV